MVALQARQLMASVLTCLDESESVVLAARRMRSLGVSSMPVHGRERGFLGMVFERDIVEHCVAAALDPRQMPVGIITLEGIAAHLIDDEELDEVMGDPWWSAGDHAHSGELS